MILLEIGYRCFPHVGVGNTFALFFPFFVDLVLWTFSNIMRITAFSFLEKRRLLFVQICVFPQVSTHLLHEVLLRVGADLGYGASAHVAGDAAGISDVIAGQKRGPLGGKNENENTCVWLRNISRAHLHSNIGFGLAEKLKTRSSLADQC